MRDTARYGRVETWGKRRRTIEFTEVVNLKREGERFF